METKFVDYLYKSELYIKVIDEACDILLKRKNNSIHENNLRIEYVEKLFEYFDYLNEVINDLNTTYIFLSINKNNILKFYPFLEYKDVYYRYHFENYIIRINTIVDLVGKIGNIIYETSINDEKCNLYNFKIKLEKIDKDKINKVDSILTFIKEIKTIRHKKLHLGKSEITNLNGVVFWDEISKITKKKYNKLLLEYTDESLNNEINLVKLEIIELVNLIVDFFDASIDKFSVANILTNK